MSAEMLLQHGWAWDASCFSGWRAVVPDLFCLSAVDRGYFGPPSTPPVQPQIVVAHSLGLHLLAPQWLGSAQLLVVLGGFQAFHPEERIASRRSRWAVQQMRQRLQREPALLLRDFYAQCFYPEESRLAVPAAMDLELLGRDLERLDTQVLDLGALQGVPRILLLHGRQDGIVPPERGAHLHAQLPDSSLCLLEHAGHALPLTRARACWELIYQAWTAR